MGEVPGHWLGGLSLERVSADDKSKRFHCKVGILPMQCQLSVNVCALQSPDVCLLFTFSLFSVVSFVSLCCKSGESKRNIDSLSDATLSREKLVIVSAIPPYLSAHLGVFVVSSMMLKLPRGVWTSFSF